MDRMSVRTVSLNEASRPGPFGHGKSPVSWAFLSLNGPSHDPLAGMPLAPREVGFVDFRPEHRLDLRRSTMSSAETHIRLCNTLMAADRMWEATVDALAVAFYIFGGDKRLKKINRSGEKLEQA